MIIKRGGVSGGNTATGVSGENTATWLRSG